MGRRLQPLTFGEVSQMAAEGVAVWEEIVWIPGLFMPEDPSRQIEYQNAEANYGKIWRDWPRKPTVAQAAAVAWEGE